MKKVIAALFLCLIVGALSAKEVTYIDQRQICKAPYAQNAILRKDRLFVDDFLTLHSLLKMVNPQSVFEIGTCTGEGTLIIKNAVGKGVVFSLELPLEESTYDIQIVGKMCYLPYVQIIGNSMKLDYSEFYPIDAWFIDGAHEYSFVLYETEQALLSTPGIIIWHDADVPEVFQGIKDGLEGNDDYLLYRVNNTRIAFSIPSTSALVGVLND